MPDKPQTENYKFSISNLVFVLWIFLGVSVLYGAQEKGPIIINGDNVEYAMDQKEVTASGNVVVIYQDTKLTCQKLTVNTQTKDARAEGNVRIEDKKGIIEGSKATYNFQTKSGIIIDADFKSAPFFGKADKIDKVSDAEFIALKGYTTTCSLDQPHYKMKSKKIDFFPHDRVEIKGSSFYVGKLPLLYLPQYTHSLKDPLMHVQLMPGRKKDWGTYMLSAWRYQLTKYVTGRLYLDYREKLGLAEGFGANYSLPVIGRGDLKFYYTKEDDQNQGLGVYSKFRRSLFRWRHKWDIDPQTNLISEYYKIADYKRKQLGTSYYILKDYFPREYEKDSFPLSYILLHHAFSRSSMDVIVQKRTNSWYSQLEKLPEAKYSLPSMQVGDTPFYFENTSSFANFNTQPSEPSGVSVMRLDATNKFSIPLKAAFINLTPFVSSRQTFYDKDTNAESIPPRTIFYSGADASTKFYRIFNVNSNLLGLDINGLRHIITPSIAYAYNHEPTILSSRLKQIDSVDSASRSNAATLELSNKLQTKRKGKSVDLVDLDVTTSYIFKPKTGDKRGSNLSDFLYKIKLLPYSWLRIEADATYKHSGLRSDTNYHRFTTANYDIVFDFEKDRSFGFGQRYQRKGGNELTTRLIWRLNPKWKFSIYERYNRGHDPTLKRGLREQEYSVSRDLHCWAMDVTYNVKKDSGNTIWLIFRLKAFPEMELGFDQTYHEPKSGAQ